MEHDAFIIVWIHLQREIWISLSFSIILIANFNIINIVIEIPNIASPLPIWQELHTKLDIDFMLTTSYKNLFYCLTWDAPSPTRLSRKSVILLVTIINLVCYYSQGLNIGSYRSILWILFQILGYLILYRSYNIGAI